MLIVSITNFEIIKTFENFVWAKKVRSAFYSVRNTKTKGFKVPIIDVRFMQVSNNKNIKLDTCNWTPVIGHPRDQLCDKGGAWRTSHD